MDTWNSLLYLKTQQSHGYTYLVTLLCTGTRRHMQERSWAHHLIMRKKETTQMLITVAIIKSQKIKIKLRKNKSWHMYLLE